MNTKIFLLITENLRKSFNLAKYADLAESIGPDTQIDKLPWTPARFHKFRDIIENELYLECDFNGTVREVTDQLDQKYLSKFFGEIWKPRTDDYSWTGWNLSEEIKKQNPRNVLDVGCGYNPFKGRIPNLVGIDPYNNCADYMIDILDYKVPAGSHDHIIALGSINFNGREDIEARFAHCVELLAPGGKFYLRVNPGISHKTGPYVDIFPWDFGIIKEFETKFNLHLDVFKKDANNRFYFVYTKLN